MPRGAPALTPRGAMPSPLPWTLPLSPARTLREEGVLCPGQMWAAAVVWALQPETEASAS